MNVNNQGILSNRIKSVITSMQKDFKVLRTFSFAAIIENASMLERGGFILYMKDLLRTLTNEMFAEVRMRRFDVDKMSLFNDQVKNLIKYVDEWRNKSKGEKESLLHGEIYECINLFGIINNVIEMNIDIMSSAGMEWFREVGRYDILEKADLILSGKCQEFIFFSKENAKKFASMVEVYGLSKMIMKSSLKKDLLPREVKVYEDKKAFEIAANIIRRFSVMSDTSHIDKSGNKILMSLKICGNSKGVAIFKEGEISNLFARNVNALRSEILKKLNYDGWQEDDFSIFFIDCFVKDFMTARWDILSDNRLRRCFYSMKDIFLQESLINKKSINTKRLFKNLDKEIDKDLRSTNSLYLTEVLERVLEQNDEVFDPLILGIKNSPYVEPCNIAGRELSIIYNFNPFIQSSSDDVVISPEYMWYFKRNTNKHLMMMAESDSIWHHAARCKKINQVKHVVSNDKNIFMRLQMDCPMFLYLHENGKRDAMVAISQSCLDRDQQEALENILCNIVEKNSEERVEKRMFAMDMLYSVLAISRIKKEECEYFSVIHSNSFELNFLSIFYIKCVSIYIDFTKSGKKEIAYSRIFHEYLREVFARQISVNGIRISGYFLHRARSFVQHIYAIINGEAMNNNIKVLIDIVLSL